MGHSKQGVDVKLGRLLVIEKDARMMVKLDEDDGALDAIIERAEVAKASDPRKVRLGEKISNLGELHGPRPLGQVEEELVQNRKHQRDLGGVHLRHQDALIGQAAVVAIRSGDVPLIIVIPPPLRHLRTPHLLVRLGLRLQCLHQALHQQQPKGLFVVQDPGPLVRALVDEIQLGARKPQRNCMSTHSSRRERAQARRGND
ncbi:uncharacterized protein A1O5_12964 [Cladophialophora psammophila CBS 110553]|uniref:Uncharacterized protein n=1 Tax=Cladophialophora psammophila CBS 110553 TaxID=1182543 RepID=W9VHE1_9EURO|nr:uncharacterized protein A1O5_12964 [Cladophialophora psammophila CBS 110553]EXJ54898.1 hypothetical protein A1O5_12964 [Cladophialophora psammophila CBS 110553]